MASFVHQSQGVKHNQTNPSLLDTEVKISLTQMQRGFFLFSYFSVFFPSLVQEFLHCFSM